MYRWVQAHLRNVQYRTEGQRLQLILLNYLALLSELFAQLVEYFKVQDQFWDLQNCAPDELFNLVITQHKCSVESYSVYTTGNMVVGAEATWARPE